ncbi:MAG TPA: FtsX-like permease family protein [Bryobacteraceae bacterium]|nr:FtsX-like permease family protein [Bryobacteraceae bacterium]
MMLLRLLSWPYVRKHALRTLLTMAGIVLGVAVFVGMHTANQSVLFAFNKTVGQIAGNTQLQVTAGESGFPEEVLEKVQAVPEVRVAVPVIEAVVPSPYEGQGSLLILGVDMTGDRSLRDYDLESGEESIIDDPLVFLAQPDSLIITTTFAQQNKLESGSRIPLQTMEGPKQFVVRGIMKGSGLASSFGGNLAIMDVYAAQKMFGRGRIIDRIDLAVQEGIRPEDVKPRLAALLGPGYQVEPPEARGQQFEALSRVYATSANITSLFALFIGLFIIYNTFSIAVAQRRSEIGVLRALGATRQQIQGLFLLESAVIGLAGSLVGVFMGILIAKGVAGYIGGILGEIYGVAQRAEEISTNPWLLGGALAIGVVTSLVAGILPARAASQVNPIQALQKGRAQMITEGENRARRYAALALAVASALCLLLGDHSIFFYAGYMLSVLAALLMAPTFAVWLSRGLRPLMRRIRPVEGTLAADSLIQSPRRTSGTVAALMLSLGLVIALGGVAKSSYTNIRKWMSVALNPDLFITTSESLTRRSYRFPPSIGEGLREMPFVDDVHFVRTARVPIEGKPVMVVAAGIASLQRHVKLPPVEGDDSMYRITAEGKGIIASQNLTQLRGYRLGQVLEIPTPGGMLKLPIVGVVDDYSDQLGSILLDRAVYMRYWKDDTVNVYRVYLKKGTSVPQAKAAILARYGKESQLFVLTNDELRDYILKLTDQWFGLTYVQIAVAVLVAILGIVNTLTVSITDRRRELGILQAVGGLKNQIRRTIWLEALCIGLVGLALGLALGGIQLYYSLEISKRDLAGIQLNYEYPVTIALLLLPTIICAALISAIGPAESAVRGSLVEALEYE